MAYASFKNLQLSGCAANPQLDRHALVSNDQTTSQQMKIVTRMRRSVSGTGGERGRSRCAARHSKHGGLHLAKGDPGPTACRNEAHVDSKTRQRK